MLIKEANKIDKKKLIKAIIIGVVIFVLPVMILGNVLLFTYGLNMGNNVEKMIIGHNAFNTVIAVIYQSLAFILIGDFLVSSFINFMYEEKTIKQKLKEFFIKLIIVLILFILLLLVAKVMWNLGEMRVYR